VWCGKGRDSVQDRVLMRIGVGVWKLVQHEVEVVG
jgi:hypothetical protein